MPTHAREGGVALLGCQYDLEGDPLYSVKWYKDGDEFFRYSPQSSPNIMYFRLNDVIVDVSNYIRWGLFTAALTVAKLLIIYFI